jgi:hypothetical protein
MSLAPSRLLSPDAPTPTHLSSRSQLPDARPCGSAGARAPVAPPLLPASLLFSSSIPALLLQLVAAAQICVGWSSGRPAYVMTTQQGGGVARKAAIDG